MAKSLYASLSLLLFVLHVCMSVNSEESVGPLGSGQKCHELSVIGGGCPTEALCNSLCVDNCYRGIGFVKGYCLPARGGLPYDVCVCSFQKGAPCPPPGPPQCPGGR